MSGEFYQKFVGSMICSNRLKEGLFIEEPPFQEGLFLCGEFSFGMADLEAFLEG